MTAYLVECYWPGVDEVQLAAAAERARAAVAELRRRGRRIEFLGSIFVPDDEALFWQFEGREEDVRAVSLRAGLPFERIRESRRLDGAGATPGDAHA